MSPISDHVFDQHDDEERAARLKRMIVGGAAFTAAGGAVAGAAVLKGGDDDLSFPDEADDKAIDKAIKATESKADAPSVDPVATGAPQTVQAAPEASFEPAMTPAAEEGTRVVGEVVEERTTDPSSRGDPGKPLEGQPQTACA